MNWWTMRTATRALSSAPRALMLPNVINILAVPERRSAYFLLLVQEKVRKEKDTPVAAPLARITRAVPCAPRQPRARAELAGAQQITARARARTPSRETPRGWLRCSACSTGV